jgi:4-coumarate--CoA ligase
MKPGSIGVTVSNAECRIVADGVDQPPGCEGELWVRGPGVMKGYLNDRAATEATIDEKGWLRTGDIGRFDDDGYLFVVDRMKELIKVKGFQVAPAELEAALLTHPAIKDAAVVGVTDADAGEVPKAFVVRASSSQQITASEVMKHLVGRVATYKQIRAVEFVDAIPRSASGKVLRRALRDRA